MLPRLFEENKMTDSLDSYSTLRLLSSSSKQEIKVLNFNPICCFTILELYKTNQSIARSAIV